MAAHLSQTSSFCWFIDSFSTFFMDSCSPSSPFISSASVFSRCGVFVLFFSLCCLGPGMRINFQHTQPATATSGCGCGLLKGQAQKQKPASISRFTFVVRCFKSATSWFFSTPCCCCICASIARV